MICRIISKDFFSCEEWKKVKRVLIYSYKEECPLVLFFFLVGLVVKEFHIGEVGFDSWFDVGVALGFYEVIVSVVVACVPYVYSSFLYDIGGVVGFIDFIFRGDCVAVGDSEEEVVFSVDAGELEREGCVVVEVCNFLVVGVDE